MNNTEYEKALTDAHGDADDMLGACLLRIKSLEELTDWAETLLCNAAPMAHCTQTEWDATVKRWRDEKHGVSTPNAQISGGTPSAESDCSAIQSKGQKT